jgi:outer membrane protein TolC
MRAGSATLAIILCCAQAMASEPWTLDRALAEALRNNPDAQVMRQRVAVARAGLAQAQSAFLPRVGVQSSYTVTDNPMLVFGNILNQRAYTPTLNFNDVPDVDDLNVKGIVTMPLYTGGRNTANKAAATANTEAAREDEAAVRNLLTFEVARAFYTVGKTRQFVTAAEATANSIQQSAKVARSQVDAGSRLRTELLDLEVRHAEAREDLVRAQNSVVLAERVLRNLLGIENPAEDFKVAAGEAPAFSVPEIRGVSGRAELSALQLREQAATEQTRAARATRRPTVSAFGSLDYDYGFRYDQDGASYTAGALLRWDLWDGNATRAKVQEAQANLDLVRAETRKARMAFELEAEEARLALNTANERLRVTEQAESLAAESASLMRSRFQEGKALTSNLIDSESALLAARVRRAEAEADRKIAIAALRKAVGLGPSGPVATRKTEQN